MVRCSRGFWTSNIFWKLSGKQPVLVIQSLGANHGNAIPNSVSLHCLKYDMYLSVSAASHHVFPTFSSPLPQPPSPSAAVSSWLRPRPVTQLKTHLYRVSQVSRLKDTSELSETQLQILSVVLLNHVDQRICPWKFPLTSTKRDFFFLVYSSGTCGSLSALSHYLVFNHRKSKIMSCGCWPLNGRDNNGLHGDQKSVTTASGW